MLLGIFALGAAVMSGGVLLYYLLFPRQTTNVRALMGGSQHLGSPREERERMQSDDSGQAYERLKKATRKATKKKEKLTIDEKFYQAGIFSAKDKREFARMRLLIPFFTTPVGGFLGSRVGADMAVLSAVMGLLLGLQLPYTILSRKIKRRNEDILYYLPLVIEQIAIGVSSSLDIGPCLQRVVSMADERDTHNVVSELVRHAQNHVKSGVSLEEALTEVGRRSGHNELKHAFMSLAQVSKHGGEITRQLQELADAVAGQRETKIEELIKKLELKATGPVALVFVGFLTIFLIGFGVQIKGAFGD